MKLAKLIFAVIMLHALLLNLPASAVAAGSGKNGSSQRGGKAAEHSDKGTFNSNAQWSADPDKGWVRADERHKMHEKNGSPSDVNQHNGKSKGKKQSK